MRALDIVIDLYQNAECECDDSVGHTCEVCYVLRVVKEAEAELARLREQVDACCDDINEARKERDEAREAARKLYKWFVDLGATCDLPALIQQCPWLEENE